MTVPWMMDDGLKAHTLFLIEVKLTCNSLLVSYVHFLI